VPAAEAVADEDVVDGPVAVNVSVPPAVSGPSVVAVAVWLANVSATAAPMAAEPPVVSPDAVVFAVAVVVAPNAMSPSAVCGATELLRAIDETLLIEIATAGATETPPPFAPVVALVVIVLVPLALSVMSSAMPTAAVGASSAVVVTSTMLRATDAPTPTDDPPVVAAFAVAFDVEDDVEVSVASPPPVIVARPSARAVVAILPMTSASEPAMPTDAPAPLVALAERSEDAGVAALSEMPCEVDVPARIAWLETFARVIAIAAPMAADPPVVALPFAVDDASAVSLALSVRRPPLVTVMPVAIDAVERAVVTVSATAAATLIGPPEVDALGVLVVPEPMPPFAVAVESAKPRSPPT
jgi:hypothetical protein